MPVPAEICGQLRTKRHKMWPHGGIDLAREARRSGQDSGLTSDERGSDVLVHGSVRVVLVAFSPPPCNPGRTSATEP